VTFSLSAHDESGAFGMVICSSSPAVASRCVHLRAGVGAVASQNVTNPQLGKIALDALASDLDAEDALNTALVSERHREYRQLVVVDARGNTAVHTGEHALGSATTRRRRMPRRQEHASRPTGHRVVAFWLHRLGSPVLGARLLDGLEAAIVAGGEAGPVHSAGLQVVEDVPCRSPI
jgi:uncharacterized Ntn-hydrolase superfamily protein